MTRDQMEEGKVPTVSTTSSVIAGIQCQEAVKLLHGLDVIDGRGFVFEGMAHGSYVVTYTRKDDCPAHDADEPLTTLDWSVATTRAGDLLERVRGDLGPQAVIETGRDLLASLYCAKCREEEPLTASLGKVTERQGACPTCGEHRAPNVYHTIDGGEAFLDRTLAELGVPPWDVLGGRCGMNQAFYEFAGDRAAVLGPVADTAESFNPEPTATVFERARRRWLRVKRDDPATLNWNFRTMPDKSERLDVSQLAGRELGKTAFPAAGKEPFRVFFDPKIHDRIAAHAAEKLSLEICGVLVGDWHKDENGPYVLINEAVRADKATSNAGDVTFTHDAWNEVNREMDTKFTDRKIVGWYHSHPSYGIFLSDRDRFCQDSTFNSPGQVAYVVDPVNGLEGVFCWRKGESKLLPHFWVGDEIHLSSRGKERNPSSAPLPEAPAPPPPARQEPPLQSTLLTLLLVAICLVLGYLLGTMRSEQERRFAELGAVDFFCSVKGLRPGMREKLSAISDRLKAVLQGATSLASEHVALIPASKDAAAKDSAAKDAGGKDQDPKEVKKKQWLEVLTLLADAQMAVDQVNAMYGLTPEETAEIERLIDEKKKAELVNAPDTSGGSKSSGSQSPAKPGGGALPAKSTAEPPKASVASPAALRQGTEIIDLKSSI